MRVCHFTSWVALAVWIAGATATVGLGGEARFFRIVSTQATQIVSFDPAVGITWSNTVVPSVCGVEWTPDMRGLWLTNHLAASVLRTGRLHHVAMPGIFATGTPSTVVYHAPGSATFRVMDSVGVDLDGDGGEDILFWVEMLSSCDVPPSTHYMGLHVETRDAEVIIGPYTNGQEIAEVPDSGDTWISTDRYGPTLVSSWLHYDWEDGGGEGSSEGPWYGVRNACLPVRANIDGRFHYGWVRLSLAYMRFNGITDFWMMDYDILDCGLQAVPDKSIRAGAR